MKATLFAIGILSVQSIAIQKPESCGGDLKCMSLIEVNTTSKSLAQVPEYQAIKYSNNQNDANPLAEDTETQVLVQKPLPEFSA